MVQLIHDILWPPCVAEADIILLPCGFFFFYLFSSPNLSRRRLDVYHTSTHGVAIGGFWATVCKTVCPMLSVRCLSVCPVLSVCLSVCL